MNNNLKLPKTFFDEDYPLYEQIGKANFLIRLEHGNRKLRYSPEQFGRGLDKQLKDMFRSTERKLLNSVQMEELQYLSKEDRMKHVDWVMERLDTYIRARAEHLVEALEDLYDYQD